MVIRKIKIPEEIYPVLLHINRQKLLEEIVIEDYNPDNIDGVDIAIQLPGIINKMWPLSWSYEILNDQLIIKPVNPPIFIPINNHSWDRIEKKELCIYINSKPFIKSINIAPPFALPVDFAHLEALAAFTFPNDQNVLNFVRLTWHRLGKQELKSGFPGFSPTECAKILYDQLATSKEPFYAWEPGPISDKLQYQNIRVPERIMTSGTATCIDLAIFLCSSIENIRRLPVLLGISHGGPEWHIIPGVKCNDRDIRQTVVFRDLNDIKKLCAPQRAFLLDPFMLMKGATSVEADEEARKLLEKASSAFLIDIQAARNDGIWPLPLVNTLKAEPKRSTVSTRQIPHFSSKIPKPLIEALSNDKCVLLLGDSLDNEQGISRRELEKEVSKLAGIDVPDLMYAFACLEKQKGVDHLTKDVVKLLSKRNVPSSIYDELKRIGFKTVVSLYPDPVLEKVLRSDPDSFKVLIDNNDLVSLDKSHSGRELYLLGGSGLTGRGLVLSQRLLTQLIRKIDYLTRNIRVQLAANTLLIMGCDLDDISLTELYMNCVPNWSSDKKRTIYFVGKGHKPGWAKDFHLLDIPPKKLISELAKAGFIPTKASAPTSSTGHSKSLKAPFKYLDYFKPEDSEIFFGRKKELAELYEKLMSAPTKIVTLFGRSGVGKTSLVMAGLVTKLVNENTVFPIYCRFGDDPEKSIINAIGQQFNIRTNTFSKLADILALLNKRNKDENRLVIIMDQTEEAFIKLGQYMLNSFFSMVGNLLVDDSHQLRFVFVVREDYLGILSTYQRTQIRKLFNTVMHLNALSHEAARDSICEPARMCGIKIEKSLISAILNDLSPDYILPSNLQIICSRMYQRSKKKWGLSLYNKLGRTSKILGEHLLEAMRKMPKALLQDVKNVLKVMVTSEKTKDLLTFEQITQKTNIDPTTLKGILNELIHFHRLLREVQGDAIKFELSHETLIDTISLWIQKEDRELTQMQEVLDQEISNATKIPNFRFPKDKLKLILEYEDKLIFNEQSIKIIARELSENATLSPFWRKKLSTLKFKDIIQTLYWEAENQTDQEIIQTLLNDSSLFYNNVSVGLLPKIKDQIINVILEQKEKLSLESILVILIKEGLLKKALIAFSKQGTQFNDIFSSIFDPEPSGVVSIYQERIYSIVAKLVIDDPGFYAFIKANSFDNDLLSDALLSSLYKQADKFNYNALINISIASDLLGEVVKIMSEKETHVQISFFFKLFERIDESSFLYSERDKIWPDSPMRIGDIDDSYEVDLSNLDFFYTDLFSQYFSQSKVQLFKKCFTLIASEMDYIDIMKQMFVDFSSNVDINNKINSLIEMHEYEIIEYMNNICEEETLDDSPDAKRLKKAAISFFDIFTKDNLKDMFTAFFQDEFNYTLENICRSIENAVGKPVGSISELRSFSLNL